MFSSSSFKDINIILNELQKLSDKKEKIHLEQLISFLKYGDFEHALLLVEQKMNEGFLKSPYQKKLHEIIPHVKIKDENDRYNRLLRLISIIKNPLSTRMNVEEILNTGSAIVINTINPKDKLTFIPIIQAFETKNKELINYLLERGADFVNVKKRSELKINISINKNDDTLLHIACELNDLNLINRLLIEGADPSFKNAYGLTPFNIALDMENPELATLLLNKLCTLHPEIDITKIFLDAVKEKNRKSKTILYLLTYWGHAIKVNINQPLNVNGDTIFHLACEFNCTAQALIYLQEGANINSKTKQGKTPLHLAAIKNNNELVNILIENNADIEAQDNDGITPLYSACFHNCIESADVLLHHHANPEIMPSPSGGRQHTPFSLAVTRNNAELVKKLLKFGCEYTITDEDLANTKKHHRSLYDILKSSTRERKKSLIEKGSASQFLFHSYSKKNESLSLAVKSICDNLYIEQKKEILTITKILTTMYEHEIIKPLMNLISFFTKNDSDQLEKRLKILIIDDPFVGILSTNFKSNSFYKASSGFGLYNSPLHGYYNFKKTVYIAGKKSNISEVIGTILHELKHFADFKIKNTAGSQKVSPTDLGLSEEDTSKFKIIKHDLINQYNKFIKDNKELIRQIHKNNLEYLDEDFYIRYNIIYLFTMSPPDRFDAEISVIVPHVLGYLGIEKGHAWLEKHEPKLLDFYINHFNPAVETYLSQKHKNDNINTATSSI